METGEWAYGAGEVADRLKDTAISSALTFSALNVPGTIRSVGSNLSAGRTVGNTGQGIAVGKEAAFEALDTDMGLGYDTFISTMTGGTQDGRGVKGGTDGGDTQTFTELSGLADIRQEILGRVDGERDGALSQITSNRTGLSYQFHKIAAERLDRRQRNGSFVLQSQG